MWILYATALQGSRDRLTETAQSQARLIEAIARFNNVHNKDFPAGWEEATLNQIRDAHKNYKGFGRTGEFTLARREGDKIIFLARHRHYDLNNPKPVSFDSKLAEPMKMALSGKSGTIIGLDYRGKKVLAAHEPVKELGLGIVAKIDLDEIREPFVRATLIIICIMTILALSGTALFLKISNPIIRRLEKQNNLLQKTTQKLTKEIEERKQLEGRLQKSYDDLELRVQERTAELELRNKELQDFAFIASHDLREPLRKIQTFGTMLVTKSKEYLDESSSEYIKRMHNSANRMQELLDSLLAYSRLSAGDESGKETDLKESVEVALSHLEFMIKEKHALINIGDLPTIVADQSQMVQLFQNLIENAIKFQRNGKIPRIKIYFNQAESEKMGTCEICVEDNGIGIDNKYLKQIFIPFQRLHARDEYEGIGMGLAICSKIVERHNGKITVKSERDVGSTFTVSLPAKRIIR